MNIKVKISFVIILTLLVITVARAQDFWTLTNCPDTVGYYCTATTSDGILFAGTNLGAYRSFDNGDTWEFVLNTSFVSAFFVTEENVIYAGSYPFYIFYSSDNGNTWDTISAPAYKPNYTMYVDENEVILFGGWQGLYKSADHGLTWNCVLPSINNLTGNFDIEYHPDGYLFTCVMCPSDTTGCGVYISEDTGDTWERTGMSNEEYIVTLEVNSQGEIFAGSRGHYSLWRGAVLKSSDLGENWTIIKDDNILVNTIEITQSDDVYIGCSSQDWFGGGVYRSSDNGYTWEYLVTGIVSIPDVKYLWYSNNGYIYAVIGENTKIYRVLNLLTGNSSQENNIKPLVFPNPFTDKLTINSNMKMNSIDDFEISIYDINGNCIYDIKTLRKNININTSLWAKGVYIVLLRNDSKSDLYKTIKQ